MSHPLVGRSEILIGRVDSSLTTWCDCCSFGSWEISEIKEAVPVKVVSERLGHESPAFTMTVYQHILPGMQAEAAATFANAVFGQ